MISAVKNNKLYYIHSLIVLFFMFGFKYLPPIAPFDEMGMQAIGIFVGTLYGWTFVDMMWPSLLCLLAVVLTGTQGNQVQVFASGFGANVTTLTIFILALAAYFEKTGLTQYLANWFLTRKCNIGHPWILSFIILLCSFVISLFTNNMIGMILTWGVIYNIAEVYGYAKKDKFIIWLICGACMSGAFAAIAVPFQMMSVIFLNSLYSVYDVVINPILYTALGMLFSFSTMGIYLLIGKIVIRPNVTPLLSKEDKFRDLRDKNKMSQSCKVACVVLVSFLLALFLPSILPNVAVLKIFSALGITGCAAFCLLALAAVKTEDGHHYINVNKIFTSGINWNIIILLTATGPMVNLLESDEAGVIAAVLNWLTPLISDASPYVCLAIITIVLGIATQFAHNMVLGMVFIPVLTPIVLSIGISPVAMTIALIFALQNAYATPASSTQAAVVFGNTDWVDTKNTYLCMVLGSVINLIVILVVFVPLVMKIFTL